MNLRQRACLGSVTSICDSKTKITEPSHGPLDPYRQHLRWRGAGTFSQRQKEKAHELRTRKLPVPRYLR